MRKPWEVNGELTCGLTDFLRLEFGDSSSEMREFRDVKEADFGRCIVTEVDWEIGW
jgi:hypothetical protein